MITTLTISLWAHLFCGPWSHADKVFGWLKSWASNALPYWAFTPFIGCAMCHAVWVALIFQVVNIANGGRLDSSNIIAILGASFGALLLDDFAELRDKWKNS